MRTERGRQHKRRPGEDNKLYNNEDIFVRVCRGEMLECLTPWIPKRSTCLSDNWHRVTKGCCKEGKKEGKKKRRKEKKKRKEEERKNWMYERKKEKSIWKKRRKEESEWWKERKKCLHKEMFIYGNVYRRKTGRKCIGKRKKERKILIQKRKNKEKKGKCCVIYGKKERKKDINTKKKE